MKPTIGRIVHYYERSSDQPQAAIVANVMVREIEETTNPAGEIEPARTELLLNLATFDAMGIPFPKQNVVFVGELEDGYENAQQFAAWPARVAETV